MVKGQPLGKLCSTSFVSRYLWQEAGREEGQWGWTLSQEDQASQYEARPVDWWPTAITELGKEWRVSGSASFNRTKWIWLGCEISFESRQDQLRGRDQLRVEPRPASCWARSTCWESDGSPVPTIQSCTLHGSLHTRPDRSLAPTTTVPRSRQAVLSAKRVLSYGRVCGGRDCGESYNNPSNAGHLC